MKKIINFCLCCILSLTLFGCKEQASSTLSLKKDVDFNLLDVLQITNETNNTVYYYFLANIENHSKKDFLTNSLVYTITDEANTKLHSIDSDQKMITQAVAPDQSTFVYGYVGYPNNNQENMGLLFQKNKQFLPFSSVNIRKINDKNIHHSQDEQFTLYKDSSFTIGVDASQLAYSFENGNSMIKGLKITYENKTDQHLVVPYILPSASMQGIRTSDFSNKGDFSKMNTEAVKKVDFKSEGVSPSTSKADAMVSGYECFYLPEKQKVECDIVFIFEGYVPDFKSSNKDSIEILLNSASLGYSQSILVNY